MDGLHRITHLQPLPCCDKASANRQSQQESTVPASPAQAQPAAAGEGSATARSLDEVFGSTIAMLKDLSRASMNLAEATGNAARLKGAGGEKPSRSDEPARQVDTLA